ncbi:MULTISPECIES: hypothetical protein [Nocardia]|uniref:hypothetical protein n=1 Tax=Nocardia TaxID=1817 RepID=UPI0007A448A6|nr:MULTISPECIES: hypothetical protein [Nocardia]
MNTDSIKWWPTVTVTKYNEDTVRDMARFLEKDIHTVCQADIDYLTREHSLTPDEVLVREGNSMVTTGTTRVAELICKESVNGFSAINGGIGVGTSTTATTAGMTSLQGTSYYQGLAGTPDTTGNTISANSLFAAGVASHAWQEWCLFISGGTIVPGTNFATATASGVMLNRAVQDLGTKGSGAAWTLAASVTIS